MRIILAAFLSFILISASAQRAVNKGKIVTASGSQDGFVSFVSMEETPQEFEFASSKDGSFSKVTDPLSVTLENGYIFEKHTITYHPLSLGYLYRKKADYDTVKTESRMLQLLLKGNISLYQLVDNYGFPHFFYKQNNSDELKPVIYKPFVNEQNLIIEDVAYKNQVNNLLKTYCGTEDNLQSFQYTVFHMLKKFEKINKCAKGEFKNYYKEANKMGIRLGVLASMTKGRLKGYSWSPSFGITALLGSKNNQQSSFFGADLVYMKTDYTDSVEEGSGVPYRYNFNSWEIMLRPFYRGYVGQKKLNYFYELGANLISYSSQKSQKKYVFATYDEADKGLKFLLTPVMSFGVQYSNVSLQFTTAYYLTSGKGFDYGLMGRFSF